MSMWTGSISDYITLVFCCGFLGGYLIWAICTLIDGGVFETEFSCRKKAFGAYLDRIEEESKRMKKD